MRVSHLSDKIRRLRSEVGRTKARWFALSADVSEDIETQARDDYYQASSKYLAELENYFNESELALGRTGT